MDAAQVAERAERRQPRDAGRQAPGADRARGASVVRMRQPEAAREWSSVVRSALRLSRLDAPGS